MKVILLKDIESLGSAGEVVEVKNGYGRNFLIPRNEALIASTANMAQFESRRKQQETLAERDRRAAEILAKKLEAESITAQVKVGEEDRLFGSVTAQHIAELLDEKGYEIDRRAIHLERPHPRIGCLQCRSAPPSRGSNSGQALGRQGLARR